MTDYIRTIWQTSPSSPMTPSRPPPPATSATSATSHPPPPHQNSKMATFDPTSIMIKLEPPASPSSSHLSNLDSPATQAQRLARVNMRRDKRKPLDAPETSFLSKRLKTEVPLLDASGEERLRAMEAQLEHLDPESKEAKKKRRLIRNRMSAQLHRERKKAYVGQLEDQLQAKEQQLKALQEQMAAMAMESEHLKQQLVGRQEQQCQLHHHHDLLEGNGDQVPIKLEPLVLEKPVVVVPDASPAVDWAACLDDMDEGMVGEDLLCDLDESPLVAYGLGAIREDPATCSVAAALADEEMRQKAQALTQSHNWEMHAAKKNLAMMMAMMFSVTFCGQSEPMANVTSGSNFSSMFSAVPVKELSQMSIASRIVACLEKTSWEDFQDVSSWTASAASAAAAAVVAVSGDKRSRSPASRKPANSPSAASDVTDSGSCDSPKESTDADMSFDTDLIEEFVYPVDEPFAPALADTNWFGTDSEEFGQSDAEGDDQRGSESKTTLKPVSMTSRLYEKLTKLWNENNQVLLTVLNGKNEVTRRSVADMSMIRKSISTGALFPTTATAATVASSNDKLLEKSDQSVTFLYPLSAFSEDQRSAAFPRSAASDQVFLEVSCQINGAASSVL
uniref:BZIP domain-containing protein n=1 Tax=Hyaloperonospora arabidopsidis (strain Emoy2) TaxID=559515 RepID=M4BP76_HYAAE